MTALNALPLLPHQLDALQPPDLRDRILATLQEVEERAFADLDDTAAVLEQRLAGIEDQLGVIRRKVCVLINKKGVRLRVREIVADLDNVLADARGED